MPPYLRPLVFCSAAAVGEARRGLEKRLVELADEIFACRDCALEAHRPELGADLERLATQVGLALAELRKVPT